jgi:acetyl esterase/lipase
MRITCWTTEPVKPLLTVLAALLCLAAADRPATGAAKPPAVAPRPKALQPPPGVVFRPDLEYGQAGKTPLLLDLAYPKQGQGPFPVVVFLHGTGPCHRGREGLRPLIWEAARGGYLGVAVSYRWWPADGFPAPIQDARAAVRWLRARAGKYPLDKERFAAVGYSGGGSVALLLGLAGPKDGLDTPGAPANPPARVQAVVSYYAPTDLARWHADCAAGQVDFVSAFFVRSGLERWLGGPPAKAKALYAKASPLTYARQGAPPILLLHGTADTVVPVEQSRLLCKKLSGVGGKVALLTFEGGGHDFDERGTLHPRLAAAATWAFLDQHLKGSRAE